MPEYDLTDKTARDATTTLRQVVDSKPDNYRYRDDHEVCVYVGDDYDAPACIVGHVLYRWGVPLAVMHGCTGSVASLSKYGILLSKEVQAVLTAAQTAQDMDRLLTWLQAYHIAVNVSLIFV